MKKLYFASSLIFAAFGVILLSSNAAGLAYIQGVNQAGFNQNPGSCAGSNCHAPNSSNLIVNMRAEVLFDTTHTTQTMYKPNTPYKIYFTGQGALSGFSAMGFQLTLLKANGQNAGLVINLPQRMQSVYVGGADVIEHKSPITFTTSFFKDSITWIAPPAGTGAVHLNLTMLAANGDATFNGDLTNSTSITLQEVPAAIPSLQKNMADVQLYPNPATQAIYLRWAVRPATDVSYQIWDVMGKCVRQNTVPASVMLSHIDISTLPTGPYVMTWTCGAQRGAQNFLKQ